MGSSQPHDGNKPFGYTFAPDDNLFLEPPEPAPGEPLLTMEDDRYLTSFFDQMTSNQYSEVSFGEGLNFSDAWHGLPPQFMGTATSYGHQSAHPMGSSFLDFPDTSFNDVFQFASNTMAPPPQPPPPPPPQRQPPQPPLHPPIEQSTSADAAAVLTSLHHGIPRQSNSTSHAPILPSQSMGPPLPSHSASQNRNHHFKAEHNSPVRATPATLAPMATPVPNLAEQRDEHLFADMAFGNPHAQSSHRAAQLPDDVRWGSDTSFGRGRSFIPSSERETAPALESERIKYIECLKLSNSAGNTRPPSPVANGDSANGHLNGHGQRESEIPARKRRKSKAAEGADEEEEDSLSPPAKATTAKKRKSKVDLCKSEDVTTVNDTPGKRRKSNATGAKPPRENLTEEQKRNNHIKSEQKRRTLIKEGFDDLQEMVPNLKNGGYSKSAMLQIAGEWLDELLKENELLSS